MSRTPEQEIKRLRALVEQLSDRSWQLSNAVKSFLAESNIGSIKAPQYKAPDKKASSTETAVLLLGDWHVGQESTPETTDGLYQYNTTIAAQAITLLSQAVATIIQLRQASAHIDKLVILMLGDMVEGEALRTDQPFYIDTPLATQVANVVELSALLISNFAQLVPKIEIHCIAGNHGRVGNWQQHHYLSNADVFAYALLKERLKGNENVDITVYKEVAPIIKLNGGNWIVTHGNMGSSGSYAGIPYYAFVRKFSKERDKRRTHIEGMIMGHYHEYNILSGGDIIVNGALCPPNDFALHKLQKAAEPEQTLMFFHRHFKKPITIQPLWVGSVSKAGED